MTFYWLRFSTMVLTVLLGTHTAGSMAASAEDVLRSYRWENRVLVLYAPPGSAALTRQLAWLDAQSAELTDRKMVILVAELPADGVVEGQAHSVRVHFGAARSGTVASTELATALRVERQGFTAVLLGLDGGVKLRANTPIAPVELFALIDAMPMRASELR